MNVGSEIETKYELDERGFERLKSAARIEKCTRQLNVYFDANWVLANRAATFRIRFTPDALPEATLKLPVTHNGATRTMKEIEVLLQTANRSVVPHRRLDVSRDLPFELGTEILRLGVKYLERVGWMSRAGRCRNSCARSTLQECCWPCAAKTTRKTSRKFSRNGWTCPCAGSISRPAG